MKLLQIIWKNLKVLFRSRTTVFILLLAPILLVLFLALAFHNVDPYKINVAVHSKSYSQLSNSFVNKLGEKNIVRKAISEDLCIASVKLDLASVCVVFPPDLKIESGKREKILVYVDPSDSNLAWQVANSISANIDLEKSEISAGLTDQILKMMSRADLMITDKKDDVLRLKNNTLLLQAKLSEVDKGINSMDLNFNPQLFMTAELEANAEAIKTDLSDAKNSIDKATAKVKNSAVQINEKDQINKYLNEAITSLNAAQNKTENEGLKANIETLKKNVDATAKRIDAAYYARDTILKVISSMETKINQSAEDVVIVETVFDDVHFTLNNLLVSDASTIARPIDTEIKPVISGKTHLGYIFATVLAIIVMIVSLLLSSSLVGKEERSKSFLMNYMTPVGDFWFVLAMFFSLIIVVGIQLTILLSIVAFLYESTIIANFPSVAIAVFASVSFFVLLGMLIGYVFKSEYTVSIMSISVALMLLLISDILLPIQNAPLQLQQIITFNPFVVSENLFKQTILFGQMLPQVWFETTILGASSFVLLMLILLVEKTIKRHSLQRFFRRK
ncbi:MAG: ABC transporter permease [Candidatus Woesearchaeota archaeon]